MRISCVRIVNVYTLVPFGEMLSSLSHFRHPIVDWGAQGSQGGGSMHIPVLPAAGKQPRTLGWKEASLKVKEWEERRRALAGQLSTGMVAWSGKTVLPVRKR